MKTIIILFTALFYFGCSMKSPTQDAQVPASPPKKSGKVKSKTALEEKPVCNSLKKWDSSGWFEKCEAEMEGHVFDATALAVCEKLAPLLNSPEESLRCLNTIKSTEYNKVEYDESALSICDRLANWEKTKFDSVWCLSIVKNKKYSEKTIKKCLKLAKPGKNIKKSLYQLDVEGTKI